MRVPFATWHRVPGSEPGIRPTQVIFHTAVMRSLMALEAFFSGPSGGIESHLGVGGKWGDGGLMDGAARQWRDTEEQADANRTANRRPDGTGAISIETTDNAPKQADTLVRIGRWARVAHGIPARICRSPADPGFGWHGMWDNTQFELSDGSTPWTPSAGKECPGPRRIAQLRSTVLPRIFATIDPGQEDEVTKQEFLEALASAEFNAAVQKAVEEALVAQHKPAPGFVLVTAGNLAPEGAKGVFAVTPLGLVHLDNPTVFARMTGGAKLDTNAAVMVHPDWLVEHLAHENEVPAP
jgi:hypothetical protein